jgi:hypothetical protein
LKEVEQQHVRVNLWFNPYVSPTAPLYQKLLPFAGTHLVWNGIVPDYSVPEARKIFADHLAEEVVKVNPNAVGGFKIDEVDGYDRYLWPDTATFPSGRDGEQLRQTYGLLVQRAVMDVFRGQNRRTMGQVRGTNGGASSLPFVIYSDSYDFNEYVTAVANSGFAGVLWSPEVRGGNAINMLRRTQAVCFSPLALYNGWASKEKLWTHADVKDHIRDAIVLRLRLLPYFYNTFAQYHHEGTPVIRPMQLVPGFREPGEQESDGKLDATANPLCDGQAERHEGPVPVRRRAARGADRAGRDVAEGRAAAGQVVRLLHRQTRGRERDDRGDAGLGGDPAVREGREFGADDRAAAVGAEGRRGPPHRDPPLRRTTRHARPLRRRRRDVRVREGGVRVDAFECRAGCGRAMEGDRHARRERAQVAVFGREVDVYDEDREVARQRGRANYSRDLHAGAEPSE